MPSPSRYGRRRVPRGAQTPRSSLRAYTHACTYSGPDGSSSHMGRCIASLKDFDFQWFESFFYSAQVHVVCIVEFNFVKYRLYNNILQIMQHAVTRVTIVPRVLQVHKPGLSLHQDTY